jgi:hypothetical protein
MTNQEDLPTGIADFEAKQAQKVQEAREQDAAASTRFLTNNMVQNRRRSQIITLAVVGVAVAGILIAMASMPSKPKPEQKQASQAATPTDAAPAPEPVAPPPAGAPSEADAPNTAVAAE